MILRLHDWLIFTSNYSYSDYISWKKNSNTFWYYKLSPNLYGLLCKCVKHKFLLEFLRIYFEIYEKSENWWNPPISSGCHHSPGLMSIEITKFIVTRWQCQKTIISPQSPLCFPPFSYLFVYFISLMRHRKLADFFNFVKFHRMFYHMNWMTYRCHNTTTYRWIQMSWNMFFFFHRYFHGNGTENNNKSIQKCKC